MQLYLMRVIHRGSKPTINDRLVLRYFFKPKENSYTNFKKLIYMKSIIQKVFKYFGFKIVKNSIIDKTETFLIKKIS